MQNNNFRNFWYNFWAAIVHASLYDFFPYLLLCFVFLNLQRTNDHIFLHKFTSEVAWEHIQIANARFRLAKRRAFGFSDDRNKQNTAGTGEMK